jgi:hypothetical protein
MKDKYKAERGSAAIRLETNSRRLRVTGISRGHVKRIAFIASFPPAALLGIFMGAIIVGLSGAFTIWGWAVSILVSALVCWFALALFVGFCFRCFVWAFNASSSGGKDDSGIVVRVRELTEEEEHRDPDSFTV